MAKETLTKLQQDRAILSARVEALSSLIEVGIIINSTFHLDEVMQLVMKKAQQVMQAEASSILLINREKKVFECPVALGDALIPKVIETYEQQVNSTIHHTASGNENTLRRAIELQARIFARVVMGERREYVGVVA